MVSEALEETHAHQVESEVADQKSTQTNYIEPIDSEEKDRETTPSEYKIMSYPADFTLEVLHEKFKKEEIIMPAFQRHFVWKRSQASKLIESFLLGLPVPPIFLYNKSDEELVVIDGQQRLKSVFSFFDGYFESESNQFSDSKKRSPFKLVGLNEESRFYDKSFNMLENESCRKLKNSTLRSIIVNQMDPEDDTSMYNIFERLNTGGTLLTSQEIRNCIYYSPFIKLLDEINEYKSWKKLLTEREEIHNVEI
ncbi:MAG: DUF262 domain-containing protein [Cyanobacteria bacterium MAG IRC4_bin_6]|nr:DUF262 domain-containing protein [Cyanobacteria bacterium MAG IRC4_bin_6]